MKRYKFFFFALLLLVFFFSGWYVFVQGGWTDELLQQQFMGEYLGIGAGYNWIFLHGSLYLAVELSLLLLLMPWLDVQYMTRMTRYEYWHRVLKKSGISAFSFCTIFCMVQLLMVHIFVPIEILGGQVFYLVWFFFIIRLILLYLYFNSVFMLIYSISGKVETAFFTCLVSQIIILFCDFDMGVFDLTDSMKLYENFYGEGSLDLLSYFLDICKQLIYIVLIYLISLSIFEKKDILYDKR